MATNSVASLKRTNSGGGSTIEKELDDKTNLISPQYAIEEANSMVGDSVILMNGRVRTRSGSAPSASSSQSNLHRSLQQQEYSLFHMRAIVCLILWYFFSFTTLFLNKYILTYLKGDATMLGSFQLFMCAVGGYFHLRFLPGPTQLSSSFHTTKKSNEKFHLKLSSFTRYLVLVGSLRFSTILLGLIALWYVPVSFAETVKSSAPVFTVIISRLLLGEQTTFLVNLSLIPVMGGLALCSAYELSFTLPGFIASLATNLSECLQTVCSKKLLSVERYEAVQLQFYTSVASFLVQIPCILVLVNFNEFIESLLSEKYLLMAIVLDGVSFHFQSLTEYTLLSYISPVTHSVANTAKRALLIWLSVLIFGNPVTILGWIGTAIVIIGVLFYNKARQFTVEHVPLSTPYNLLNQDNAHDV